MSLLKTKTYTTAVKGIAEMRNLRKVKLFPRVRAVTVVTYYKESDRQQCDYAGTAYTFDWMSLKASAIELAHTTHSPPTANDYEDDEDDDEQEEIEVDPQPSLAIGCRLTTAY